MEDGIPLSIGIIIGAAIFGVFFVAGMIFLAILSA
jgi:hypothetical protein